jgi:hypothetical protein
MSDAKRKEDNGKSWSGQNYKDKIQKKNQKPEGKTDKLSIILYVYYIKQKAPSLIGQGFFLFTI